MSRFRKLRGTDLRFSPENKFLIIFVAVYKLPTGWAVVIIQRFPMILDGNLRQ